MPLNRLHLWDSAGVCQACNLSKEYCVSQGYQFCVGPAPSVKATEPNIVGIFSPLSLSVMNGIKDKVKDYTYFEAELKQRRTTINELQSKLTKEEQDLKSAEASVAKIETQLLELRNQLQAELARLSSQMRLDEVAELPGPSGVCNLGRSE